MRLTEVWFWWSQFLEQKSTICLQNVLQLPFSYWTESRYILDQCYLHQELWFVWGIWWLSLQSIAALITRISAAFQSRQSFQLSQECLRIMEGFPGNETGTVTALMFLCAILQIEASQIWPCFMLDEDLLFPIMQTL